MNPNAINDILKQLKSDDPVPLTSEQKARLAYHQAPHPKSENISLEELSALPDKDQRAIAEASRRREARKARRAAEYARQK